MIYIRISEKWTPTDDRGKFYDIKQRGHWAMYREHLVRLIGELGDLEYDVESAMWRLQRDLEDADSERAIKRGESIDENKAPLIDDEEWIKIKYYNTGELETWDQRNALPTGRKWKHMGVSLKSN